MNFNENEKRFMETIESNIRYYNGNRRKKILGIKYYVEDGNKAKLTKDNRDFLTGMTIEQAYYAVAAITNYMED